MLLIDLIKSYCLAEAQAGDWITVAAIVNSKTVEVRNPKSWTMADLIGLVGAEGAALVGGTIQAAGSSNPIFAGAWIALNVTGLQLHTDDRQQMIDGLALAGNWPDDLKDLVKSAGVTHRTILGDLVSPEQCQAAWAENQRAEIVAACISVINEDHVKAVARLNNAQASLGPEHINNLTLEELQARCDAVIASEDGTV